MWHQLGIINTNALNSCGIIVSAVNISIDTRRDYTYYKEREDKDMESIITALITGGLTLIGTVMTVSSGQKKTDHKLEMAQAVTDCKLDELTREVRMHNNFAQRVPVIEEQVKVINHRIADLEEGK